MTGRWVSLFSGGKDSSWALYRAIQDGLSVEALLTVHPPADSFMYHVPATRLADIAASSLGFPLIEVEPEFTADGSIDATEQGDREIEPLEDALREFRSERSGLEGVIAGAIASEYQANRLADLCDRLGCELFAPLWGAEPIEAGLAMINAGFDIRIVGVAADGLGESWLGRRLDRPALDELATLAERHGIHVLGEGGEYETLVVAGPHMDRPIEFAATTTWDGVRGELIIDDAWLA